MDFGVGTGSSWKLILFGGEFILAFMVYAGNICFRVAFMHGRSLRRVPLLT